MPKPVGARRRADFAKARNDATRREGLGPPSTARRRAMVTARPINVERALVDPRAVFQEPVEVLACADLDDAHKRQILECWR